jgi:hypothetical protein
MTTNTNTDQRAAVVVGYDLDGKPVKIYDDPRDAQDDANQLRQGVTFTDTVWADKPFRSASRISQILKQDLFPKGAERVGTRVRGYTTSYEGFVVEAAGIYGGFVKIGWVLPTPHAGHPRPTHAETVEAYNKAYERMARRLGLRGFVVVHVPARLSGYGFSTGMLVVVGKNEVQA